MEVTPISIGGDHSVTLPIFRALAREGPIGMVHFDAHCDTGDDYAGSKFHHGSPFKVERGFRVMSVERLIQSVAVNKPRPNPNPIPNPHPNTKPSPGPGHNRNDSIRWPLMKVFWTRSEQYRLGSEARLATPIYGNSATTQGCESSIWRSYMK